MSLDDIFQERHFTAERFLPQDILENPTGCQTQLNWKLNWPRSLDRQFPMLVLTLIACFCNFVKTEIDKAIIQVKTFRDPAEPVAALWRAKHVNSNINMSRILMTPPAIYLCPDYNLGNLWQIYFIPIENVILKGFPISANICSPGLWPGLCHL